MPSEGNLVEISDDSEPESHNNIDVDGLQQIRKPDISVVKAEAGNDKYQCKLCEEKINGFRYICVQCPDYELCNACESRETHAFHYMLRVPRSRPYVEIKYILHEYRKILTNLGNSTIFEISRCHSPDSVKLEVEEEDPLESVSDTLHSTPEQNCEEDSDLKEATPDPKLPTNNDASPHIEESAPSTVTVQSNNDASVVIEVSTPTTVPIHTEKKDDLMKQNKPNNDININTKESQETNNINENISNLMTIVNNLVGMQSTIINNQEKIKKDVTGLHVRFDHFTGMIQKTLNCNLTNIVINDPNRIDPITNENEMKQLEEDLKDPQKKAVLKKKFSIICSKGRLGINNAYKLVDVMFTRQFMTTCSWGGGTKGDTMKMCFKQYQNVINFFLELIHDTDNNFTLQECELFFKNILRNSKKRKESLQMRTSTAKNRIFKRPRKDKHEIEKRLEVQNVEAEVPEVIHTVQNEMTGSFAFEDAAVEQMLGSDVVFDG